MVKTYSAKKSDVVRQWYLIDAKDKVLGRVAAKIAVLLRGKHKAIFSPHVDTGDSVIVVNASKIKVTGRKLTQKVYRRYSGYPGGLREVSLQVLLDKKPETVMKLAVRRMLPRGSLGVHMLKKLRVFGGEQHTLAAQKPKVLEV